MSKTFIKDFSDTARFSELPDPDYWFSREEHILSYLWHRNAPVPRVTFKDNVHKKLNLDNVGQSFDLLLDSSRKANGKLVDDADLFTHILLAMEALQHIFDLGVLHLDISLRNLVSPDLSSKKIFVIDFSHSLNISNRVQKPIPLVPIKGLHHPLLFDALVEDWNKFLCFFGHAPCDSSNQLNISREEFIRFWSDDLRIQSLSGSNAVLAHQLGNLIIEFYEKNVGSSSFRDCIRSIADNLQFKPEAEAVFEIAAAKQKIQKEISQLTNKCSDKTLLPRLSDTTALHNNFPIPIGGKFFARNKTHIERANKKYKVQFVEFIAWTLVAFQIWWVDLGTQISGTVLPWTTLVLVFICVIVSAISLLSSLFLPYLSGVNNRFFGLLSAIVALWIVYVCIPVAAINVFFFSAPIVVCSLCSIIIYASIRNDRKL